jgi:hypothetical protein
MDQSDEELRRAVRTVKRSLAEVKATSMPLDEADVVLFDAFHELVFVVGRLLEERARRSRFGSGGI